MTSPQFDNTLGPKRKDGFHRVMVVDIGSLFVKYLLIVSFNGVEDYVVSAEIKYFDKFNYHLFSRDLQRRIEKFKRTGIDQVIILPSKGMCSPICLPRFEYQDSARKLKEEVKKEFKNYNGGRVKSTFDWSVLNDEPKKDYQSIFIDSMPESELFNLGNNLVTLGLKNFIISSPTVGYVGLVEDNKAHLIVDIGDSSTTLAIVRQGAVYLTSTLNVGGKNITQSLTENAMSPQESMIFKHHSEYRTLGNHVNALVEGLKQEMTQMQEDYERSYRDKLVDYIIIGGSSALEFEEDLNKNTVGLDRSYPKMSLANDEKIPSETRNYFFPAYSAYKFYSYRRNDKSSMIDMMSSKSGGLGLKLREFLSVYEKSRGLFYAGIAIFIGVMLSYGIDQYYVTGASKDLKAYSLQYTNKGKSLGDQEQKLLAEHKALVEEATARKGKNTGDLLAKLGSIVSPDLAIRDVKMIDDGEVTTLEIVSTSQKSIADYLVLLSEQCFNRANIEKVLVEESQGVTTYKTTVKAEGRRL